jgi:hypothetical protein
MVEVRTHRDHPASMAERIAKRLDNSGDVAHADVSASHGTGPTRTKSQIHHTRNTSYGEDNKGEPGIDGKMRGPANRTGEI